jgi:anti-sigma regulatory factor (Ser/Thr protein kinase)
MTDHPADPNVMAYSQAGDLSAVRAFVAAKASALGLSAARVELLILAVSELTTNTLQHTTGGGRIRVWSGSGQITCDVVDGGALRPPTFAMPAADTLRGRGLAIVERICDGVEVSAVAGGTLVRIWLDLSP